MSTTTLGTLPSARWPGADDIEALTFEVSGETFALDASIVREILDLLPETTVPGARPFVRALVNFRGRIIPLADIRFAFGMPPAEPTIDSRIIVVEQDFEGAPCLVGLRADKVNEVRTLAKDAAEAPPRVGMRWRPELVECLIKLADAVVILPDLHALLHAKAPENDAEIIRYPKA
ncbi:purine-binding chemotaxis protein CheW [Rhodoblastus acidophilus]|uniref:Purine-binding chemotaxis protein CheW n=2 Tax=Rhodoblastus acidophilus TaxID=1074 RepID=A0A212SHS6_RHOAC|nr:chemotaxis protein CheW [Rhodoblastus acidophilus]PPQ36250.1 chemotaxis protein CheW [Rhodoblastus acidophilus]RAI16268.1 chemotaxis protein CheW [Rhodoblastus acidophilus]SNB85373.1 purine-binding chemotaxis protein CheW [Rhodoblastus acidophilus]